MPALGYDDRMKTRRRPLQFSTRTLLRGTMWLAFLIAIYLQDHRAMIKHRQRMDALHAAGLLPPPAAQRTVSKTPAATPLRLPAIP